MSRVSMSDAATCASTSDPDDLRLVARIHRRAVHRRGSLLPALVAGLLFALLPIGAAEAAAQDARGTIAGQVTGAQGQRPVASAQVFIPDLNLGVLSQSNGRFTLTDVPVGTHTLRVERLGYRSFTQDVTVQAGETVDVEIRMTEAALDLDEIVVTGTGAPTQRRRLGQSITSVSAEELATAPITGVADALVGRLPGAHGLMSGGQTGAGSRIVLRGASSLTQRTDPVIYVDGVRMENRLEGATSVQTDRLSDINPQDIERIEVIKGAAAATLYGTEASSGVIQIFTRRGQSGAPQYTFSTDVQYLDFSREFPENCAYDSDNRQVVCEHPYGEVMETGYHHNYNLSVRGGSESVRYYVSGRLMGEVNPSPNNTADRRSIRGAFDFTHTDRLSSSVDVSFVQRNLQVAEPSWGDAFGNLLLGNPLNKTEGNPYGTFTPFMVSMLNESYQDSYNILMSGQVGYEWADNLRSTVQVGHNVTDTRWHRFFPQGIVAEQMTGTRAITNRRRWVTTLDVSTSWERQLSDRLMANVTVGGQSFWEGLTSESANVREFGSPTLKTLSGGQEITNVSETFEEVINAGLFAQGQIGLDDRLFLTVGVRSDGNSAFGEDFGMEIYPKAGLSWVVSDYDFWNVRGIDEFRLRAAMGSAGLQPGAFDAQRTWSPEASVIGGYLEPDNVGNPDLRPERSTEIEFAVETGMLGGRFGAELVYFRQETENMLLEVPNPPSTGFTGNQLMNVGGMRSQGLELSTEMRVVDRPGFAFDLNVNPTWLDQEITDLGEVGGRRLGSRRRFQSIYEGMWPGIWIAPVQDPNEPYTLSVPLAELTHRGQIIPNTLKAADGTDSMAVIGRPHPNWTLDMNTTFQIGERLTIRNIFEAAGGFVVSNETDHLRMALANSPLMAELERVLDDPTTSEEERFELVDEYGRKHNGIISNTMYAGDYLRWAEANVSYRLPEEWTARLGGASTTLSLGVRNLHVFSSYFNDWKKGMQDPNTRGVEDDVFVSNVDYLKTPPLRRWVVSLRAQF